MTDLLWLSEAQLNRIRPYFPLSHGVPRVDDGRVISGIVFVIKNGLRWRDAPKEYGPHKTLYNRFMRWSRSGAIGARPFVGRNSYREVALPKSGIQYGRDSGDGMRQML